MDLRTIDGGDGLPPEPESYPMSAFLRFRSVVWGKADITNVIADFRS
jgi:hypothetical protein